MSQIRRMIAAMPEKTVISDYVQDGLVLAYDGYQAPSGGVWKDLSPSHNHMALGSDATYNTTDHCLNFGSSNGCISTKEVALTGGTALTMECIFRCTKKQGYVWRTTNTKWPYRPNLVLGTFYLIYFDATQGTTIWNGGYNLNYPAACQVLIGGGDDVAYSCRCSSGESWGKNKGTLTYDDVSTQMLFGYGTAGCCDLYALRLYNRKLTDAEILQNRHLDIERWSLLGSNTDVI